MKKIFLIIFLIYLFLSFFNQVNFNSAQARLIFLDVGQGDAVLLISPKGKTLLIDGGPDKLVVEKINSILPRRINKIDWVILSHDHNDHSVGLAALLDYYFFGQVIGPTWSDDSVVAYWLDNLEERGSRILFLENREHWFSLEAGCQFGVWPSPLLANNSLEKVSSNNSSFSVKIDCFGIQALLTGDLEKAGEQALLEVASLEFLKSEIFKAGHHGSNTSNNLDFLEVISPRIVVISLGKNNPYNHPGSKTINNLEVISARIFRTDVNGTITFSANNRDIFIKTES